MKRYVRPISTVCAIALLFVVTTASVGAKSLPTPAKPASGGVIRPNSGGGVNYTYTSWSYAFRVNNTDGVNARSQPCTANPPVGGYGNGVTVSTYGYTTDGECLPDPGTGASDCFWWYTTDLNWVWGGNTYSGASPVLGGAPSPHVGVAAPHAGMKG